MALLDLSGQHYLVDLAPLSHHLHPLNQLALVGLWVQLDLHHRQHLERLSNLWNLAALMALLAQCYLVDLGSLYRLSRPVALEAQLRL